LLNDVIVAEFVRGPPCIIFAWFGVHLNGVDWNDEDNNEEDCNEEEEECDRAGDEGVGSGDKDWSGVSNDFRNSMIKSVTLITIFNWKIGNKEKEIKIIK